MRFVDAGPDIPYDLIVAQERGETIFVCGAGVSRTAGLPLFHGLVEDVYRRLGENWTHHPAERAGMAPDGKLYGQYDRVLRCLERRLSASDAPRNRNMKERIRAAVREALAPPQEAELSNHLALLELSRDAEGQMRLLTTNFDTLFERAWQAAHHNNIPSHAGVALPQPKTVAFSGVLHLHGRLADASVQVTETDWVLTSAEFGDAYLRSGWASRYVYDLVRGHTVVLVGYQAEDPPMRYLLEALEADRERYPDLKKVYAFGHYEAGERELIEALWRAKGVEPILYQVEHHDHSALYNTLQEWRRYADDPTAWRREQLRGMLDTPPTTDEQIQRCLALLNRGDAQQLLGELSPVAAWLPIVVEAGLHNAQLPDVWIASRINDSEMIRACAGLGPLDEPTRWRIERTLDQEDVALTPAQERAWRLLLGLRARSDRGAVSSDWYDWAPLIRRGQTHLQARQIVARIVQPRLKISKVFRWHDEDATDDAGDETLHDLLRLELEPADHPGATEILEVWPDTAEQSSALFRTLDRAIFEALEQASDLGLLDAWDTASHDVPSIASHPQNSDRSGFQPITRVLAELWQRIAGHDPALARALIAHWSDAPYLLLRRLYLFALANEAYASGEVATAILALDDETFWDSEAQVEVMRLLVGRWPQWTQAEREALEERLCRGVPAQLYVDGIAADADRWSSIVDNSIFRRLKRIEAAGGLLTDATRTVLGQIAERHPTWQPQAGDRDDFGSWHETRVGPDGHPELLAGIADDHLVREAFRLQQERQYDEGDLWRVFCSADPERALRGLKHESEGGQWAPEAWRYLLWAASEQGDLGFQRDLADQVLQMPPESLGELVSAASSWIQRQREALAQRDADNGARFFALWDRLSHLAYDAPDAEPVEHGFGDDLISEALNRSGGMLAASLLDALAATQPEAGSELNAEFAPRFERLIAAGNHAGLLARVYIMRALAYLDAVAPEWTSRHLLPRLDWAHQEALPLWRAFAHGKIGSARLFNALRPAMLDAFERKGLPEKELEGVFSKLLSVAIWHRKGQGGDYIVSPAQLKHALTIAPSEVRRNVAWNLWRMMADETIVDKAAHWRGMVGPLFADLWPLDVQARGKTSSERLVLMALECGAAFPEAVSAIMDVLVPYQLYQIAHALRLERHHQDLLHAHPRAFIRLVNALIDATKFPVPNDLPAVLQECVASDAGVVDDPAYIRLNGLRRLLNA